MSLGRSPLNPGYCPRVAGCHVSLLAAAVADVAAAVVGPGNCLGYRSRFR